MLRDIEVRFATKTDSADPYQCITHIAGYKPDGSLWKLSVSEAIKALQSDKYVFYLTINAKKTKLTVASKRDVKYLKSITDRDTPESLLNLPECPAS